MATEQPVPERPTPDWSVEPRPCSCCADATPRALPDPLRWDGDDT